jgi:glycosyltransferase involved in cell wall biosynthesis
MRNGPSAPNGTLRVAINAQLQSGTFGGIVSYMIGLVHALGQLADGDEEYIIITSWRDPNWLECYLGPNQRIVAIPSPSAKQAQSEGPEHDRPERFKRMLGPLRKPLRAMWRGLFPLPLPPPSSVPPVWPEVPVSDGFYEGLNCDVIHFPYQTFTFCAMPMIYNPHDLQHRHFPEFFTLDELKKRESIWRIACQLAHTVVVGAHWIKDDVAFQFQIAPRKVQVIPWAPPTQAYAPPSPGLLQDVRRKYQLPEHFALYPAITWPHKNHIRLLEALASLRDKDGLTVALVCTGGRHEPSWPRIQTRLRELELQNQVHFLDRIPGEELRALYRLAQFLVMPTLFEEHSQPIFEAWLEELPVTCSTVTSLPEQVGAAALLFDAASVEDMANAIRRMATDSALRTDLVRKGTARLQQFSWERTAKAYRAVYRRAAGRTLSPEDEKLLAWDWMRYPDGLSHAAEQQQGK